MKHIIVATAALNQTPLDWHGNTARILEAIESARHVGASILCLPELCISGYGCEDMFLSPAVRETAWKIMEEIVPRTAGIVVSLGLPLVHRGALFNAACLVTDERLCGLVPKRFLAREGIHYEPRWFTPWPEGVRDDVVRGDTTVPCGDLVFSCEGVGIGFEICEDAWVAQRPGRSLAMRGVDVILNPSASHFAFGKHEVRKRLVLDGSRAFGVAYLYANLLGNEAGRAIYDGGAMIASGGRLVAQGRRLSFADVDVTSARIDLDRTAQGPGAVFDRTGFDAPVRYVHVPFALPTVEPLHRPVEIDAWEEGDYVKEEAFTRAVALGLFDYLRKSRTEGFVVSLSGGADSAAVSCLAALAVRFGLEELGPEAFAEKLSHVAAAPSEPTASAWIRALLCCVYQGTRNSSSTTRDAARQVAVSLGAKFLELDIDPLVDAYVDLVSDALGRELDWQRDDIALQNIQARTRAPGVWMIANLRRALLLATSNRSEAAVGYTTMDGDTCGGLSPIAGIDKAFLQRWLAWMERAGPDGVGAIPALAAVNVLPPTAELRPPEEGQTDETDLMPYPVLDAIERFAIRDKHSPLEVYRLVRQRCREHDPEQLRAWVDRFFQLWHRNQWKRERYAPSVHLDDENLDPKTWCRFPILSGGFERELETLRTAREIETKGS